MTIKNNEKTEPTGKEEKKPWLQKKSSRFMEQSDQDLLKKVIVDSSRNPRWHDAKREWELITIHDEPNHCVCGHFIIENCVIRNRHNGNVLVVGNVCVNHFGEKDLEVDPCCRRSLRKLQGDPSGTRAAPSLIHLAHTMGIISSAERDWYLKWSKGKNSSNRFDPGHEYFNEDMYDSRERINRIICMGFHPDRPKCMCGEYAKPRQNRRTGKLFYGCKDWPRGCHFTRS